MSLDGITVDAVFFQPIRVSEETLEGLIRTAAPALFPGYNYFDFRPAIRCGLSTRHPDGVLLAKGEKKWWVVEVETHLHSVTDHIEPQLGDLASGFYGPDAFKYLRRHRTFDPAAYEVDTYEPAFLLIIDSLTPEIRHAASRKGFETIECTPFRSLRNEYALAVAGHRPNTGLAASGPGIDLRLQEEEGMAVLRPVDGGRLPKLRNNDIIIGDVAVRGFVRRDRRGLVLPVTPTELRAHVPGGVVFRLTPAGQLYATLDTAPITLTKE